jgi:hypothetical protein
MSEGIGKRETVEDALARRVEDRRGAGSPWAEALRAGALSLVPA